MRYEPRGRWATSAIVACLTLVIVGGVVMLRAWVTGPPWMLATATGAVVFGVLVLVRLPRVGIRFDDERLVVSGMFWSRTIPRERLDSVPTDPFYAWVRWHTRSGIPMRTPLTVMWPDRSFAVSGEEWVRAREFLRALTAWQLG